MNGLRHRDAARRLVGAVLLSMLLGQWAVLAHAVTHAWEPAGAAAPADADGAWGHHAGTPVCQLVDHLLAGQAPGGKFAAGPCLPPVVPPGAVAAASIGPGAASRAYEARGPPAH